MRRVLLAVLVALPALAWAQAPAPAPPSCEEQLAGAAQYVNQVRLIRDQYEAEMTYDRAVIQRLRQQVKDLTEKLPKKEN